MPSELDVRVLLSSLARIDGLGAKVDSAVASSITTGSLRHAASGSEYSSEAFAYAAIHLTSGYDALRTMHLMAVPDPAEQVLRITVNGSAGLVRQGLESFAFARWILGDPTVVGLQQRGYAARWNDVEQQAKYLNALGGPEPTRMAKALIDQVTTDGFRLDLLRTRIRRDREVRQPRVVLPAATDALANVRINPALLEGVAEILGLGSASAAWLYRWLSGMAHGYAWASLSNVEVTASLLLDRGAGPVDSGVRLGRAVLDYQMFNLALWTAVDLCSEVADTYGQAHQPIT